MNDKTTSTSSHRGSLAKERGALRTIARKSPSQGSNVKKRRQTNPGDAMVAVERPLWLQFRALAALRNVYGRELLATLIRQEIAAWESKHRVKIETLIDPESLTVQDEEGEASAKSPKARVKRSR